MPRRARAVGKSEVVGVVRIGPEHHVSLKNKPCEAKARPLFFLSEQAEQPELIGWIFFYKFLFFSEKTLVKWFFGVVVRFLVKWFLGERAREGSRGRRAREARSEEKFV